MNQNEKWRVRSRESRSLILEEIKKSLKSNISDFVIEFLVSKGYNTAQKIDNFIMFSKEDIPDESLIPHATEFIQRVIRAIHHHEHIVVYGDYDADGVNATVIALRALRALGAKVDYHVNNRFHEGYGISVKGVTRLLKTFPTVQLILTVDNGILGFEGIDYAMSQGIDVVVSDHHEPKEDKTIPNAIAVVDLKRIDDVYPYFQEVCGAGLIYKLMKYLYKTLGRNEEELHSLLSFVAVATISDLVPLHEENRFYVREGLRLIKEEKFVGFKALRTVMGIKEINEETMGFKYGPLLNATGRLNGDVSLAIEMFMCDNFLQAEVLAASLNEINERRKVVTLEEFDKAKALIESSPESISRKVIVLVGDFHEGIVGIVAGKIKELHSKPAIVLSKVENGLVKGSARSTKGFNLKDALDKCSELLMGYGGHEMAAGLTLKEENVEAFIRKINDIASTAVMEDESVLYVDFPLTPSDLSIKMVNDINTYLRPFGQGFEKPVIGLHVAYDAINIMKEKHLKFMADKVSIIWFNGAEKFKEMGEPMKIKCIGTPGVNVFNGKASLQFMVQDDRVRAGL